jgi:hypothetical protein
MLQEKVNGALLGCLEDSPYEPAEQEYRELVAYGIVLFPALNSIIQGELALRVQDLLERLMRDNSWRLIARSAEVQCCTAAPIL